MQIFNKSIRGRIPGRLKLNPGRSRNGLKLLSLLIFIMPMMGHGQDDGVKPALQKKDKTTYQLNDVVINTEEGSISFPCIVNMNDGLLEVILCTKAGKLHESLLSTTVTPLEFQTALLLLGLDPVNEEPDDPDKSDPLSNFTTIETPGDSVMIFLTVERDGKQLTEPIEHYIFDESVKKPLGNSTWLFRGPVTHRSGHVLIDPDVTMIATYSDPIALMELNSPSKFDDELFYVNKSKNLIIGEPVTLIIKTIK
ncbi:MAG: YdjY domain-containing protein [Bacteroidales bacterium]|nr:hypothetical protein [Bacteroidales bacterium]